MKLTIYGQVPSLKNAKTISVNKATGSRFVRTEKRVKDFMQQSKDMIFEQWLKEPLPKIENLTCVVYNQDLRKHDLSNVLDTVCDILKGIVFVDDDQFCVPSIQIEYGGVDKLDPRVEVWVSEC